MENLLQINCKIISKSLSHVGPGRSEQCGRGENQVAGEPRAGETLSQPV